MSLFKVVGWAFRKIRMPLSRELMTSGLRTAEWLMPCFQEKLLSIRLCGTVPQTDTGGRVEYTKALERTRVKELGKMVP